MKAKSEEMSKKGENEHTRERKKKRMKRNKLRINLGRIHGRTENKRKKEGKNERNLVE